MFILYLLDGYGSVLCCPFNIDGMKYLDVGALLPVTPLLLLTLVITLECCAGNSCSILLIEKPNGMAYSLETVREQKGLKIVHVNARSVIQHFEELHNTFLDGTFEVVIFTESWLHKNCADSPISVRGYSLYRLDRQVTTPSGNVKKGGGIVIYVRDGINVTSWPMLDISDGDIEAISLTCKMGTNITAVYRPPTGKVQTAVDKLESIVEDIRATKSGDTIVIGDLNVYLLVDNVFTRKLKQFANS